MSILTEIANHEKRITQLRLDYATERSKGNSGKMKFIIKLAVVHKDDIKRLEKQLETAKTAS